MIAISRCVRGTSLSERFKLVGVSNSVTKETLEKTKTNKQNKNKKLKQKTATLGMVVLTSVTKNKAVRTL